MTSGVGVGTWLSSEPQAGPRSVSGSRSPTACGHHGRRGLCALCWAQPPLCGCSAASSRGWAGGGVPGGGQRAPVVLGSAAGPARLPRASAPRPWSRDGSSSSTLARGGQAERPEDLRPRLPRSGPWPGALVALCTQRGVGTAGGRGRPPSFGFSAAGPGVGGTRNEFRRPDVPPGPGAPAFPRRAAPALPGPLAALRSPRGSPPPRPRPRRWVRTGPPCPGCLALLAGG